ncbi:MAG: hypothetical protein ABI347_03385 [Nitrososphaera sp.]
MAILPEGSVRDEGTFLVLVTILAVLVGVAMYLRHKRNKQPDYDPTQEQ